MPRRARPTDEGLVYHALNRGNNRADVFETEDDYEAFLEALAKAQKRYPFRLFGYCLMPNHFHLLLRPEAEQSVSRVVQSLMVAHTARYHKQHGTVGHVWQGRFKSLVVQDDDHLLVVLRYIEANPVRAGLVAKAGDYRWSSFGAHGFGRTEPLLALAPIPELEALGRTPAERRMRWRRRVEGAQRKDEVERVRKAIQTGMPLGGPEWAEKVAARLGINLHPRPRGRPPKSAR